MIGVKSGGRRPGGLFVTCKTLILFGVLLSLTFAGSIIATYFGARLSVAPKDMNGADQLLPACRQVLCTNASWFSALLKECPVTTPLTTRKQLTNSNSSDGIVATTPHVPQTSTTAASTQLLARLPTDLKPLRYDLRIQPYFTVHTRPTHYDGFVQITFECLRDTRLLQMHKRDIEIDNSSLLISANDNALFGRDATGSDLSWSYDNRTDFFTLTFLEADRKFTARSVYTFSVRFMVKFSDSLVGFYRASYDTDNATRWSMASQMQFIEARRAFPCFDEPLFRSVFSIQVVHDDTLWAVSNMPVKRSEPMSLPAPPSSPSEYRWHLTEFEDTVPMSTYLVALVVSDFACLAGVAHPVLSKNVSVRVCVRTTYDLQRLNYLLERSIRMLELFEQRVGVAYSLAKLDHFAFDQFKYSGMENWGLVLYQEGEITNGKPASASLLAHEIAHMWFGNLVTPEFWDSLWLSEGFANYMEFYLADLFNPQWRMSNQCIFIRNWCVKMDLLQSEHLELLDQLATDSAQPISVTINTPSEITTNYLKGSAVIKMLLNIIGEETFYRGITRYLNKFAFKNVQENDLWVAIHDQAKSENKLNDVDLPLIMSTWTKNKGFPMVHITHINRTHIGVSQHRFVLDADESRQTLNDVRWHIPLFYEVYKSDGSQPLLRQGLAWIHPDNSTNSDSRVEIPLAISADETLIVNPQLGAFYRCSYERQNWMLIARLLQSNKNSLPFRTRRQLLNEAITQVKLKRLGGDVFFEFVKFMAHETETEMWNQFPMTINYFQALFAGSIIYESMETYLGSLPEKLYERLGRVGDQNAIAALTAEDRFFRNVMVLPIVCNVDGSHCARQAKSYFAEWLRTNDINVFPIESLEVLFCSAIKFASTTDASAAYKMLLSNNTSRNLINKGLTCSNDISIISKLILRDLASNRTLEVIRELLRKPRAVIFVWNAIKSNWNTIYKIYPESEIDYIIYNLGLTTDEQYHDMVAFFTRVTLSDTLRETVDSKALQIKKIATEYSMLENSVTEWLISNEGQLAVPSRAATFMEK